MKEKKKKGEKGSLAKKKIALPHFRLHRDRKRGLKLSE